LAEPANSYLQSWTIKEKQKKRSYRSPFVIVGIHAYSLGEDPDKISSRFNEPFLRKWLYKEIVPKNMALSQKSVGKIRKITELTPFDTENIFTRLQEILTRECLGKI
jgi:hypothetical protein